uniref:Uncharacterized protein n=1 Tax=viral metagenome TaxID=1070528 RepID=A0A6C0KRW0_9ZZZZ
MTNSITKIILIILIFLGGLYIYIYTTSNPKIIENLTTMNGDLRCPNLLIQKGSQYYLYNSNIAQVPGVNPIQFNNLEEYNEFLEWQRGAGIRCPVLYVQNTYDAQGNRVYKVRPSVNEPQGGLPPTTPVSLPLKFTQLVDATRNDSPYNQNSYPAFDQSSYYVGSITPLDQIKNSEYNMLYSDNAMDPNWGGAEYTQALTDAGYYKDNNVNIYVP